MVMETDPSGNFLTQGYEYMSGRDWARLGNLYLNDGVAPSGERLLPEYFNDFVSTLAPAWLADENPVYGGFFWINGDGRVPLPNEAYSMQGAGVAGRREPRLWRVLLDQRRRAGATAEGGLLDAGRRRTVGLDRSGARPGHRADRQLPRPAAGRPDAEQGDDTAVGGRARRPDPEVSGHEAR
jgi:hypothetical protein